MIEIDQRLFADVAAAIISNNAYQAVKYVSPKLTLKITRQHKAKSRDTRATFIVTMGRPAFREAARIKQYQKSGVAFPIRNIEIRFKDYKKKK